ncbi:MAG TPA: hypothetical protein PLJ35_15330 [Anaerolineae bacterium]|nr:hypothetical protein [Anaerolineae bacterium]HPL30557.1 hypothetical protein [Anaerolineae bacterium]
MEEEHHLPRSQLFNLRLWVEDLGDGQTQWRGTVLHALSGDARYFRDWPSLLAFLTNWVPSPSKRDSLGK